MQLLHVCRGIECVELLHSLPSKHFHSGWVKETIGRAMVEGCDYPAAVVALRDMLRIEPYRLSGVEALSTALWHLRRDKDLCALAQQVVDIDKFSCEAWCVVGNCFSLQREHETALKYFERALQVDPNFAYAHTLSGHEHVLNEDLEKASVSFRAALSIDSRHYNAWYGLGSICYRQERFQLAEFHFRNAVAINPKSSVLRCYLAMVLLAQGSDEEALDVLDEACLDDKRNPQLHFQRAHVLVSMGQLVEARDALLTCKALAPRETPVYTLLGKVCLKLNMRDEALKHLDVAVAFDSKEAATLKGALNLNVEPHH